MFRYVAVIWSSENEEQTRAAQLITSRLKAAQWQEPMRAPGMRVFQTGARPGGLGTQLLPGAAGVVIGRTFERAPDALDDTPARQWRAIPCEAQAILASRGRWLVDRCWGNYAAILRSPASHRAWIVKDPTGTLPCFVTAVDGVTLIFSFADDLVRLGLCRFTINRAYLRARVIHGADFRQQPLNEVEQIRRGESVELDPESAQLRSRQFLWRPQSFTDSDDTFEDPDLAAQAMRASVRMSTHSWAAMGPAIDTHIVHRLSGGLDSSIVAGCLSDAPSRPRVCCYTYFTPGAPSDERPWARLVAAQLNCEHREVPMRPQDLELRRALRLPLHVEPVAILTYMLRSTIEQEIASDVEAPAVFTGDGGDSIFGAEAVRYAASEYVRRRGLRAEVLRIAASVALRTHQSSWGVLYDALSSSLTGATVDPVADMMPRISRLIRRDALAGDTPRNAFDHPWFADEAQIPWSTVRRLGMLPATPEFYDASPRDDVPEIISPLYSQPVAETLLRIPLYRLFEGGRDRGLARRAFERDVPEPILARLWKDRAPGFHEQLVFLNRAFLREVLLDGVLAREGLLDRAAIEEVFAERPSKGEVLPAEIMRHFDVEMWARAWESPISQSQQQNVAAVTY